jgi:hypothetical protein
MERVSTLESHARFEATLAAAQARWHLIWLWNDQRHLQPG